ncbi:hypothetical protein MOC16_gp021 [Klebsiella phage vB_KpM_FBKp24]|uniref:Uncharacterized protein n=2 Tax=root TaxID=1 RepID=A0A7U0GBE7_9CAUD|nr:hypothetical protein MOC16_gp021 [Klebsiella phage vB_KpM_FBKp24]QQV92062.1 hypothetical protein vBKpMFBKp24_021 [Klebsiella phage vB_KpM_FBKp24]
METEKNTKIVKPVPGVFTFIGEDGKNLRDIVMELNNQWSFYMVKRVGDDAQLDALNETLENVEKEGVDRSSMAAVEALNIAPLSDHYPVNSYTLKRSKTQQKVACEEIGKQIAQVVINAIKTAIKWVKEKMKSFVDFFTKTLDKQKRAETDEFLKKIEEMGFNSKMRTKEEILHDPKLSPMAAAIEENYTVYADRAITSKETNAILGSLVKHPEPIVDYMEKTVTRLESLIKAVVTGKWDESHEIDVATVKPFKSEQLEKLLRLLNGNGDSLNDRLRQAMTTLATEQEEHSGKSLPYDVKPLTDVCKQAFENLKEDTSPFIYPESASERIITVSRRIHASLEAMDKLLEQAKYFERDRSAVYKVREVSDNLFAALQSMQFITDVACDFYDENRRWLKRLYMFLVYAQPEE